MCIPLICCRRRMLRTSDAADVPPEEKNGMALLHWKNPGKGRMPGAAHPALL